MMPRVEKQARMTVVDFSWQVRRGRASKRPAGRKHPEPPASDYAAIDGLAQSAKALGHGGRPLYRQAGLVAQRPTCGRSMRARIRAEEKARMSSPGLPFTASDDSDADDAAPAIRTSGQPSDSGIYRNAIKKTRTERDAAEP